MSTKLICDYCLKEITSNYTTMNIQTVDATGVTAQADVDNFEFHPGCYNALQGLIVQLRESTEPEPIDPKPKNPPKDQPTNPEDPAPPDPTPEPEPTPEPTPEPPADPPVDPPVNGKTK